MSAVLSSPSPERSAIMRAVKSRDTGPELVVRKLLREIAPGYRLCAPICPASPISSLASASSRFSCTAASGMAMIARAARARQDNAEYWRAKIARNRARDQRHAAALAAMGWRVLTIHECELRHGGAPRERLGAALA